MSDIPKINAVLEQHLNRVSSSFSIGTFGAIAEFHRSSEDPVIINKANQLTIMTRQGAIRLQILENTYAIAYEAISKNQHRWQQGVVFCLSKAEACMNQRKGLTELGHDQDTIDSTQSDEILFDMGINAYNIDFCIRTKDPTLIKLLRQAAGLSYEALPDHLKSEIINTSPCRVVLSKLGRIEVYQAIGKEKTPHGPHTHLLPKLFTKKITHSANTPIPENLVPCLTLHPGNPLLDHLGQDTPFNQALFKQFEQLLDQWGLAKCNTVKKSLIQAVLSDSSPSDFPKPVSREARATLRVTLRQMRQQDPYKLHINEWCEYFELNSGA